MFFVLFTSGCHTTQFNRSEGSLDSNIGVHKPVTSIDVYLDQDESIDCEVLKAIVEKELEKERLFSDSGDGRRLAIEVLETSKHSPVGAFLGGSGTGTDSVRAILTLIDTENRVIDRAEIYRSYSLGGSMSSAVTAHKHLLTAAFADSVVRELVTVY